MISKKKISIMMRLLWKMRMKRIKMKSSMLVRKLLMKMSNNKISKELKIKKYKPVRPNANNSLLTKPIFPYLLSPLIGSRISSPNITIPLKSL